MKKILLVAFWCAMLFLTVSARAQLLWTNLSSGLWSSNAIWNGGVAPTSGSNDYTVIFNATATDNSTNNLGAFTLNRLVVINSGNVNLYGSNLVFDITSDGTVLPQLLMNGGASITFNNGVTLNTNLTVLALQQRAVVFNAIIDGAGTLIVSNAAGGNYSLVTLNAANTYSGGTQIGAGRLQLNSSAAKLGTGTVTISAGAELYISQAVTLTNNFYIAGNYSGENLGAIRMDNGALNGSITLTDDAALGSGTGTGTINASLSGDYNLWKLGAGTLVLNATNTVTGNLTVAGGVLRLNASNSFAGVRVTNGLLVLGALDTLPSTSPILVSGGVAFNFAGAVNTVTSRVAWLSGPTGGTLALTAANAGEAIDFSAAYFTNACLGAYGGTITVASFTPNGSTYRFGGGTGTLVFTNPITSGSVLIGGSTTGTVILTASNSFSGPVIISNNILRITNKDALGLSTNLTIVSPVMASEFQLSSGSSGNWVFTNLTIVTDNAGTANAPTLRNVDGTNTFAGTLVTTGTGGYGLLIQADGGLFTFSGTVSNINVPSNNAVLFLGGSGNAILNSTIDLGNGVLRKGYSGTWRINSTGNNWLYSYIENGRIILGTNDALSTRGYLTHGSTAGVVVDLNGYNQTLQALNSTRTDCFITNGNGAVTSTLTLSNATATAYVYSSFIRGNIALVLSAGTQILTATNGYTAGTTINGGALLISTNAAIGTGPLTINFGGGIGLTNSVVDQTFLTWVASRVTNDVTGAILLAANNANNLTFTGVLANAFLGAVTNVTYSGVYTPASNTYRLGMGGGILTFTSAIADGAATTNVNIAGPGVVLLTATNTYTGPTTVFGGGTLRINSFSNLPYASNLILSNGILELNNLTFTRGLGSGSNQVQLTGASGFGCGSNNATITLWNNSGYTVIWGTNGFTPDVLVLQGPLSTANSLTFNNPIDLIGTNRAIDVRSAPSSGVAVLAGAIRNSAANGVGIIKGGTGVLQLQGANTYDGATVVTGGVLRLGANTLTTSALPSGNLLLSNGVLEINYGTPGMASFTRSLGTGLNQIQFASGTTGGFSAVNGPRIVNLGGAGDTLVWGSPSFDLGALLLAEASGNARITLANGLDLNGANRTILVNNADARYGAMITGVVTNTGSVPAGLIKAGSGYLFVVGNNYAYDGPTVINAGVIALGDHHLANGALPSAVITNYGTLMFNNPFPQTFSANVTGTGGLTKNGRGTLTITGTNNTFTGTTTVNAGQLLLDYSLGGTPAANLLPATSSMTLGQDAVLYIKAAGGAVTNLQAFRAFTVNTGASRVVADSNGGFLSLQLSNITRNAGGVIDFALPANGEILTSTANTTAGILGGYATVGGTDWAASGWLYYLPNKITNYTGYTTLTGANPVITGNGNANLLLDAASTGNPTFAATTNYLNTIAFKDPANRILLIGNGTNLILGTIGGILVAPGAGAQTISGGTLTAGATPGTAGELVFINNSANPLTVNSRLANNGTGTLTVTIAGSGGVNLAGTNAYTGYTYVNGLANFTGSNTLTEVRVDSGGTATFNGLTTGSNLRIGQTSGGRGVVYVTGGITTFTNQLLIGTGGEAVGSAGALIQTGGLLYIPSTSSGAYIADGYQDYAYYNLAGGTLIVSNSFVFGHRGYGVMEVTGGTNSSTPTITFANGDARCPAIGILRVSAGLFNAGIGGNEIRLNGNGYVGTYGVITVEGSGVINAATNDLSKGLNLMAGAGNTGIVNINPGGTVIANRIYAGNAIGLSVLNLNGGTILAAPGTTQGTNFMANITAVYLTPAGITLDTGANAITITNSILAPVGYGVTNIAILDGGGGYIGNPAVQISGGSGTGATAIAQIDFATGVLTNIVITSAGSGYQPGDVLTVNLYGGGFTNPATLGAVQFGPNTNTGGIVKLGTGTLALTGTNTFTGGINVSNGLLIGTTLSLQGPITNNGGVVFDQGFNGVFNGLISGAGYLGKQGTGLVILATANTYTGNTFLTGGVLRADYGIGLSTANLLISNAVWETGANITNAFGTAAGQIQITGGTAGFSAFGSPITVNLGGSAATLVWGTDLPLAALVLNSPYANTNLTFVHGLDLAGVNRTVTVHAATATITGVITNGALTKTGAGNLALAATNSYDGVTTLNAGTLTVSYLTDLGADSGLGRSNIAFVGGALRYDGPSVSVNRGGTLTASSVIDIVSGNLDLSGVIRGNQNTLTKTGAGTLTLSGTGDNDSLWVGVSNGVVVLNKTAPNARIAAVRFIANGGTIQLAGNNGDQIYGGAGYGITNLNGTLDMNGRNESISGFWGGSSGLVTNTSSTNSLLTVGENNDSGNFAGVIADNIALTKIGAGTLTLSGPNTYTGITLVNTGFVVITHGSALGDTVAGTVVSNGAMVLLSGGITVAEPISLNGDGTPLYSGALRSTGGDNTWSGLITLPSNARINATSGSLNITGGVLGTNRQLVINASTGATISFTGNPVLLGSGGVFYTDAGGLTVLGVASNTWSRTLVAQGTLRLDVANALPSAGTLELGVSYQPGATVDLNGFDQTVAQLKSIVTNAGVRTITSATPATLTVDQTAATTFDGQLTGALTLIKANTGILTLTRTNTHTGNTLINGGTLAFGAGAAAPNTARFELQAGAVLDVTGMGGLTLASGQELKGSGAVLGGVAAGNGSQITPGNSVGTLTVGTLTLADGVLLNFELGSTNNSDLILVSNALNLDGMNANWFVLSAVSGFGEGEYTLFDAANIVGSLGANTNFADIGGSGLSGYLWLDNANADVKLTVVPEPGTGALVGMGLLALLALRRWHR